MRRLMYNFCRVPPAESVGRPQATRWPTTPIFTTEIPSRRLPWQRIYSLCAPGSRFVWKLRRIQKMRCLLRLDFSSRTNEASGVKFFDSVGLGERKRIGRVAATRRGVPGHRSLVPVPKRRSIGVLYLGRAENSRNKTRLFVFQGEKIQNRCLFSRWNVELPTTRRGGLKVNSPNKSTSVSIFLTFPFLQILKLKKI